MPDYTCGARVDYVKQRFGLGEEDACRQIIGREYPGFCGPKCDPDHCNDPAPAPAPIRCGCNECDDYTWNKMAGDYPCGSHITWWHTDKGLSEEDACITVSKIFPTICGPRCNPERCDGRPRPPLQPDTELYCYPDYNSRVRYTNVWGDFIMEVKESGGTCGPGDNFFDQSTVEFDQGTQELKLLYKQLPDGRWSSSEVRLVLPDDQMPFQYGRYMFEVSSVKVMESDGTVVSNHLPPDLVLGLFTWDDTVSG